ncbi:unnamed protein product [Symbiodinium natans]|uniref:Uncharacterized protein n=1 Tax=Symbiodinium natans TaxID=878477 RepID=A0A812MAV1_9DINO|nr:unnamed protein product [Symbiodinium natans]
MLVPALEIRLLRELGCLLHRRTLRRILVRGTSQAGVGVHGVLPWTAADCGGFVCFRRVHLPTSAGGSSISAVESCHSKFAVLVQSLRPFRLWSRSSLRVDKSMRGRTQPPILCALPHQLDHPGVGLCIHGALCIRIAGRRDALQLSDAASGRLAPEAFDGRGAICVWRWPLHRHAATRTALDNQQGPHRP